MTRNYRYLQIAKEIASHIESGEHAPGMILASEAVLAKRHEASRATIRKALEALREQGLIDSRQGFGWFVAIDSLRQSLDRHDTIEAQLQREGRKSERQVVSFAFVQTTNELSELLGETVLEVARINLADSKPFAFVTVWCRESLGRDLSHTDVENRTFVELLGDRLGSSRQTISATAANEEQAQRLSLELGAPLLRVKRVTNGENNQVAMVSEHLYPAHLTEFEVTLERAQDQTDGLVLLDK